MRVAQSCSCARKRRARFPASKCSPESGRCSATATAARECAASGRATARVRDRPRRWSRKASLIETSRKRMASRPAPGTPRPSLLSSSPPPPPRSKGPMIARTASMGAAELDFRSFQCGRHTHKITPSKHPAPRGITEECLKSAGDSSAAALLILGAQPRSIWGAATAGIDQTLRVVPAAAQDPSLRRHGRDVRARPPTREPSASATPHPASPSTPIRCSSSRP